MADVVADTTESVVNVDELAKIESLKELVKEAEGGSEAVSSEVVDNDDDSTNPEIESDQNGTHEDEHEHNGNGTTATTTTTEETNGTHDEAKEENGSVDLKRKSEGDEVDTEENADEVNEVLPEKKAKLDEEEEKVEEPVSSNGDAEIAV